MTREIDKEGFPFKHTVGDVEVSTTSFAAWPSGRHYETCVFGDGYQTEIMIYETYEAARRGHLTIRSLLEEGLSADGIKEILSSDIPDLLREAEQIERSLLLEEHGGLIDMMNNPPSSNIARLLLKLQLIGEEIQSQTPKELGGIYRTVAQIGAMDYLKQLLT